MTYYKIETLLGVTRYAENLDEAEKIFNKLIKDDLGYVILSLVNDGKTYTEKSLKVHW